MRKQGWQLPYHPLQVVAISVFLALGFAFYVFFIPFVGRKLIQYVVLGLYTPLVACVVFLYVWCAATDPGDPGVFKSKKYLKTEDGMKQNDFKSFKQGSSTHDGHIGESTEKAVDDHMDSKKLPDQLQKVAEQLYWKKKLRKVLHPHDFCTSIGLRGLSTLGLRLQLILQWSIGILVLILCFLERKRFSMEISAKLGSSFSLVPFIIVVASCTFLALLATLPVAQLLVFHVLLIKKGISTYDYIVALREQEQQEQQAVGQQSPQMSSVSSYTGLSSASSFSAIRRDAWCTPPRLFLEDQFDVVPPEVSMPSKALGKKMMPEESARKRSAGTVKISPWTLARLNAEEVSKAAAEAKKKSKILQPVVRQETRQDHETENSFGSGSGRMVPSLDNKWRTIKRGRTATDRPLEPLAKTSRSAQPPDVSTSLGPLQLAARSAFRTSRAMSSTGIAASSPDSSLESPDLHPCRVSSFGAEDSRGLVLLPSGVSSTCKGVQLLRSTSSDGYEASGGEDSDGVPSRIVHRSVNWANLLINPGHSDPSSSTGL